MPLRPRFVPVIVAGLIVIGVGSSVGRGIYPDSLVARIEPVRTRLLAAAGVVDPFVTERGTTVARVDARFGDHRPVTYLHIVLGSIFLLVAPLQFSERLRRRHRPIHRWTGRILVTTGISATVAGLFFGLLVPFAGMSERIVVGIVGSTVIASLIAAVISIRRGDVTGHRAWMVRAFALMLGIATVRIVAAVLDFMLTPLAWSTETVFVTSLWIGWGGTLALTEVWLRHSGQSTALQDMSSVRAAGLLSPARINYGSRVGTGEEKTHGLR